jgi:uncharacterized protein (DUF1501 family)
MDRREFFQTLGAASLVAVAPRVALAGAAPRSYGNLLILVELRGGNDGLNTVVPYADPQYYRLRPRIGIARDQVLQLDERTGLHPSLQPLAALWQDRQLAIVQGVSYPNPNLSHFRSIEIWDTASSSTQYLRNGWLARVFAQAPAPRSSAADGVVVGTNDMGPFDGSGARAIVLNNPRRFLNEAKLAMPEGHASNPALGYILRVEHDIVQAAARLRGADYTFKTEFPKSQFGNTVRIASQVAAANTGVPALLISLNGFDTHHAQPGRQAALLKQLADGLVALKSALQEVGRWDSTLVMTYAEFGRRAAENMSNGTDHGTANAHFVLGGGVKGGFYGSRPDFGQLDGNGNLPVSVDFRDLYATVLEKWWDVDSVAPLKGRFRPLDVIRI